MKKIIKKIGGSIGVTFTKEDMKIYELTLGDVVDLKITKQQEDTK